MAFTKPICTELTVTKCIFVGIFCSKFYPNQTKTVEHTAIFHSRAQSTEFTTTISTKLTIQWHYMGIFNNKCHPNCLNNKECTGIQLIAILRYSLTVTDLIFKKLAQVRQIFVKNYKTEFHENLINTSAPGITHREMDRCDLHIITIQQSV